jgi:hypothetical protein
VGQIKIKVNEFVIPLTEHFNGNGFANLSRPSENKWLTIWAGFPFFQL